MRLFKWQGICAVVTIVFCGSFLSDSALAADNLVQQKTVDAPMDRVFAGEAQAAGRTLKNVVKEGCLVNFETREISGAYSRVILWTAVCKDVGGGKTSVTLSAQMNSSILIGNGKALKKGADSFWNNLDSALKNLSESTAASASAPSQSDSPAALQVTSEPTGAEIVIDGEYQGSTPSELKLKPGAHAVRITLKGYQPWERSIRVDSGDARRIVASAMRRK